MADKFIKDDIRMIGLTNHCMACKFRTTDDKDRWACVFYGDIPMNQLTGGDCPNIIHQQV